MERPSKELHACTPWKLITEGDNDFTTRTIVIEGRPRNLSEVALITTGSFSDEVEEANAAFIIEACNSFDQLKAENARLAPELEQAKKDSYSAGMMAERLICNNEMYSLRESHRELYEALKQASDTQMGYVHWPKVKEALTRAESLLKKG